MNCAPAARARTAELLKGLAHVLGEEGEELRDAGDERAAFQLAVLNASVLDSLEYLEGSD